MVEIQRPSAIDPDFLFAQNAAFTSNHAPPVELADGTWSFCMTPDIATIFAAFSAGVFTKAPLHFASDRFKLCQMSAGGLD